MREKFKYEVRQISALHDGMSWYWNDSYHIGEFQTSSENVARALRRFLNNRGIFLKPHTTVAVNDWNVTEIVDRSDGEPLFAAILQE